MTPRYVSFSILTCRLSAFAVAARVPSPQTLAPLARSRSRGGQGGRVLAPPVARFALALVAALAVATLAAAEVEPAARAEGLYLSRLLLAVVGPLALVAALPANLLAAGAGLLAATPWLLPAGPARGAVLGALAVGLVIVAAAAHVVRGGERREQTVATALAWVALALAAQAALRGAGLLLGPLDAVAAVRLFALPALGGLAAALLATRLAAGWVLTGLGAALLVAPGFNLLLVLAGWLAVGAVVLLPRRSWWWRGVTSAVVLVGLAVRPEGTLVAGLAAALLAVELPAGWPRRTATVAALVATAVVTLAAAGVLAWPAPSLARAALWTALLVPVAFVAGVSTWRPLAILPLAALAAAVVPEEAALAVPLLALGLLGAPSAAAGRPDEREARDDADEPGWGRRLRVGQAVWLTGWWLSAGALAGYPWLREAPLGEVVAGVRAALSGAVSSTVRLPDGTVVLDARQPRAVLAVEPARRVSALRLESHAVEAAGLAIGTPLAEVTLLAGRRSLGRFELRVGIETADWAAARPGAASPRPLPPVALAWLPPGGGFFAQRYRAAWPVAAAAPVTAVALERAPGLPRPVAVAVSRLELVGE